MNIQLDVKYKKVIDSLLMRFPYAFFVFGSRSKNKAHEKSDLDLCIKEEISLEKYAHIKEALQNLLLPFSVDLVLWSTLSENFKKEIEKDLIRYTVNPLLEAEIIELSHIAAGIGTHIDAPADSLISLKLVMPTTCFVFYPQEKLVNEPFMLTRLMLKDFEKRYGEMSEDSWFLCMSGWGLDAFDRSLYGNISISLDAAEYLVEKKIRGFGIDTNFSAHACLLAANILIIENIKYVEALLPASGFLQVVPFTMHGGTRFPARVFFIEQHI